jgi:hypothetical protein
MNRIEVIGKLAVQWVVIDWHVDTQSFIPLSVESILSGESHLAHWLSASYAWIGENVCGGVSRIGFHANTGETLPS